MNDYKKWTASQRNKSLSLTKRATAMGIIPKATKCRFCGQEKGIIHSHNMDYDVTLELTPKIIAGTATEEEIQKVMEVLVPVCWKCHIMIHKAEKHPLSAEKYFERVKNGEQFKPTYRGNAWEELDCFMID